VSSQLKYDLTIIRGGNSRGIYLRAADLPADPAERDATILAIFGSSDPRQIDGLAGADPLTSKVAVVRLSSRPDADVDYAFGQVSIEGLTIGWSGDCDDTVAGVGTYAIGQGLVAPAEPVTSVRVFDVNLGRVLHLQVPVTGGQAAAGGEVRQAGSSRTTRLLAEGSAYVPASKVRDFQAQMNGSAHD
jgi:2-methylaconitate cis-trans-isomerase PrpF